MPSPLLPPTLTGQVAAYLAGRSLVAVRLAVANGNLPSYATADVEGWIGRAIDPLAYLAAERRADAVRRATKERVGRLRATRRMKGQEHGQSAVAG